MKVVTGVLHTAEGDAALGAAAAEVRRTGGELLLVGYVGMPFDAEDAGDRAGDAAGASRATEEAARRFREQGLRVSTQVPVAARSPAEAILQVARDAQADLIVIGIRRRSRVEKLVLGSNAQDILLAAEMPVLAVKRRPPDARQ